MTSKIVVNNIESDSGISSVTVVSNITGQDSTQNISGINSVTASAFYGDGQNITGSTIRPNFTFDGTDVQVPDRILLNTGGSSIKSNQLKFQSGGDAYIDQTNTSQSINIRVSSSSALDTTAMTINHNGHITRPNNPCASMTIDSSTISGSYMSHSSVHTNIGNHYNTGTSIFTCPVAGLSLIHI